LKALDDDLSSRPVRIIVPFPPGGATDIIAGLTGQWLSERLGQQFVTENRPRASSNIGTEVVVNATGRLHAPSGRRVVRNQYDPLRETQFQLSQGCGRSPLLQVAAEQSDQRARTS
jgi:tripartite-type tricarboxylate transporter receptor subunit TctC